MGEISITREDGGDECVIRVSGELDAASAPELETELRGDHRLIRLDLSEVTFIDSRGLRVILAAARSAAEKGHRVVIENPSSSVRRLLEVTGLGEELSPHTG